MEFSGTDILKLAATTGIFTTLLSQGVGWLRETWTSRSQKRDEATYLALRLAVILEQFVIKCVYRTWRDEGDVKEGRELDYHLPELASYPPDSSDWKSFHKRNRKLAGQVLSFPNVITSAEMLCEFQKMREGNPFASADETVVAGVNALKLAESLRKAYSLAAITIAHVDRLEAEYKKLQERTEFNAAFAFFAETT